MAFYGTASLHEARASLAHSLLGPKPELCTRTVLEPDKGSLHEIFGSTGGMKLQSSMTLFALAAADSASVFYQAFGRWCHSILDPSTLKLLDAGDLS